MNLADLEAHLAEYDRLCEKYGRFDSIAAPLVMIRDNPPTGYKVLTPFGRCHILNCKEVNGKWRIVFAVSRKQVVNMIRKLKKEQSV